MEGESQKAGAQSSAGHVGGPTTRTSTGCALAVKVARVSKVEVTMEGKGQKGKGRTMGSPTKGVVVLVAVVDKAVVAAVEGAMEQEGAREMGEGATPLRSTMLTQASPTTMTLQPVAHVLCVRGWGVEWG